jgi:hypothetical protein
MTHPHLNLFFPFPHPLELLAHLVTMFIIPGIQNITPLGYPNQRALAANTNENHQTPKTGGKKNGKKKQMQPIFNSYVQLPEGTWSTFDQPWLTTIPRRFGRARPKVGPDVCISLTS